jgi:hypothetical protein
MEVQEWFKALCEIPIKIYRMIRKLRLIESAKDEKLQRVWLILAKVHVLGSNRADLRVGSEALVQCFVPEIILEVALRECDRLLQREGMRRLDVLSCASFDTAEDEHETPKFVRTDLQRARETGQALTGTFFTSD